MPARKGIVAPRSVIDLFTAAPEVANAADGKFRNRVSGIGGAGRPTHELTIVTVEALDFRAACGEGQGFPLS
jgi:hypothetical protein